MQERYMQMLSRPTPQEVLNLEFEHYSMGTMTIRDYFITLLTDLWEQAEGFSAKRPFGDSGWQYDIYVPLIEAGYVPGFVNPETGDVDIDTHEADHLIFDAIGAL